MSFGKRLKELRIEKSLSTYELAAKLNISREAISTWERGRNYPSQEMIKIISDFFNVSRDYLLCDTDIREKPEDIIKKFLTKKEYLAQSQGELVAKDFSEMSEEDQQRIIDYMQILKDRSKK